MNKQQILERASELDIYQAYLPELTEAIVKSKKNILSPFRDEKKPSFSIYEWNGKILFKDNVPQGYKGDVFQFVAYSENLDNKTQFKEVLHKIDWKLNLGLNGKPYSNNIASTSKTWIPTYFDQFTEKALEYWATFKITKEILDKYGFKQLKRLKKVNPKKEKGFDFYEFEKINRLGFENRINRRPELYVPKQEGFNRKLIMKLQKKEDIFGFDQLPKFKKVEALIIIEGKKDVMCLTAHDYHAITFQSASIFPTRAQMREIKRKAKYVFIGYDNQPRAKAQAKAIAKKYNIIYFEIPTEAEGEDMADWLPKASRHQLDIELEERLEEWKKVNSTNLWEYQNSYWKYDSKAEKEKIVSNFIIEVEALIVGQESSQRIVSIKSNEQSTHPFSVDTKVFSSPSKFTEFVESKGNFYFYGNPNDLMNIKKVAFDLCQFATETHNIGHEHRSNAYIFSNGIVKNGEFKKTNQYGIVENIYIPSSTKENQFSKEYESQRKYQFHALSNFSLQDLLLSIDTLYGTSAALISIAHIVASTVFDHIGEVLGEFPLLNIYGKPRSGKTTLAKIIASLYSKKPVTPSLKSTTVPGFTRTLAQTFNIPQIMEEYNNSIGEYKIEALKNVFNLIGRTGGVKSQDDRTRTSKINAPTIIIGEEPPIATESLLSRFIIIELTDDKKTAEKRSEMRKLQREIDKGLGKIFLEVLAYRSKIMAAFENEYHKIVELFSKELEGTKDEAATRLMQNHAIILTPLIVAVRNGLNLIDQTPEETIEKLVYDFSQNVIRQASYEKQHDELMIFWEIISKIMDTPSLQDKYNVSREYDFKVAYTKKGNTFSFNASMLDAYGLHFYNLNRRAGKHKSALIEYLKNEPYYIDYKLVSFQNAALPNTTKQYRAYVFDLDLLAKKGIHLT